MNEESVWKIGRDSWLKMFLRKIFFLTPKKISDYSRVKTASIYSAMSIGDKKDDGDLILPLDDKDIFDNYVKRFISQAIK